MSWMCNSLRAAVEGAMRVEQMHVQVATRVPAGVSVEMRSASGLSTHRDIGPIEIELRGDPARYDLRSLYLILREALGGTAASGVSYDQFRAFQRELLRNPDCAEERRRWREAANLDLAGHRLSGQKAAEDGPRLRTIERTVPEPLATAVRELSASRGWEAAAVWLMAWAVVLSRRTSEDELLVRVGLDGRNYEELLDAIGPYARDVPVRIRLGSRMTVADAAAATDAVWRQAWTSQEHYDAESDAGRVWPFGFEYQSWPERERLDEVACEVLQSICTRAQWNGARLRIEQTIAGTRITLHYDAGTHAASTMTRVLESYLSLLHQAVEAPGSLVEALDYRGDEERAGWAAVNSAANRTRTAVASTACIHEWIERVAAASPHAPAVRARGDARAGTSHAEPGADAFEISYAELNARANQLARHLVEEFGIGPEARVGLCLPRGPALVTAMLAMWKARAAYVPFDDEWPPARIGALLARTQAARIIVNARTADRIAAAGVNVPVIDLERDAARIDTHAAENLGLAIAGEQLAYVLFTSGSTGEPKGVAVEHRQLVHYTAALLDRLHLPTQAPSRTFATMTTAAADLGNTAILGALCSGGTLEWIDRQTATDAVALDAYCRDRRIDVAKMTPSHVRALLGDATRRPSWLPREVLVLGGEAFGVDLVQQIHALAPELRVVNHYGPTETTIGVIAGAVDSKSDDRPPLGTPLGVAQAWVCRTGGAIAGIGDAGDLWIGGPSVTRGYWHDPVLTADRFRPDPYSGTAGARLYRTGDRARWRDDGAFEYLGRADDQVKVRGYRVEPEEVAQSLRAIAGVRQAAVTVRRERDAEFGEAQLIAYIVADPVVTDVDVRAALEQRLPSHMVPGQWVRLDRLPLLPNGKLDRTALPDPAAVADASMKEQRPLTPTEEIITAVWASVLNVQTVNADDHFFLLGGDSILSLRALSLLQGRGLNVSLQTLTAHPVLSALARAIDAGTAGTDAGRDQTQLSSDASDASDAYPLTQLQLGMVYHIDLTPDAAVYHDTSSIHVRLPFELSALQASLDVIGTRHPVLRTSFDLAHAGGPLQRVHDAMRLPLIVEDWRGMTPDEQERALADWMARERCTPFDVRRAPLIRFSVHLRSDDSFQLSSTCHHAILDGWSATVMRVELLQDYARRVGLPLPSLPGAPPDLMRTYVQLERAASASESSLTFWRGLLDGAEPHRLPRASTRQQLEPATQWTIGLSADTWSALGDHARRAALPVRILLLAAHVRVCALLGGRADVITGVVSNGRPEIAGGDRALGLFLNTLPFRIETRWEMTWRQLCDAVLARELQMLPHRRVPLATIQQANGAGPLFEAVFNFVNFHEYGPLLRAAGDRFLGSRAFSQTHFDLLANFSVDPVSRQSGLELQCRAGRFSRDQIALISAIYQRTLESIASDGLDASCEARGLLRDSDAAIVHGPEPAVAVRDLLSWVGVRGVEIGVAEAAAHAVLAGSSATSYRELIERARQFASALRERGVDRGALIGICLDRSADLVSAIIASLGLGAAYVPLDPLLPPQRIHTILSHAACQVLITSPEHADALRPSTASHVLLTSDAGGAATEECGEWPRAVEPDELAYVIYTSGSTGVPKGVGMTRRAAMNLVAWQLSEWREQPPMRTLLLASPGFDVSFQEIFCTLAAGGTLHPISEATKRDPDSLLRLIADERIERIFAPPVIVQALAEADARSPRALALREIIAAGEAFKITDAIREFLSRHEIQAINQYGPTETHVVSASTLGMPADAWPVLPAIGAPIAASRLYVLDADRQPVPPGVSGELYAAGDCLARGYLHDPALTADRFVPDPLSRTAGARMYRTGDVVWCRDDRQLEYVGRADGQVKIRGNRVEIGEIEAALVRGAGISAAAVVPHRATSGQMELWSFVVVAEDATFDTGRIVSALSQHLPAYMLPARIARVDRLPMLPNGKIDRRQLASWPAPETKAAVRRPPTSAGERIIANTMASVLELDVDRLGLDEDFFQLGGNSLTAVQAVVRLRDLFGCALALETFHKASTVAAVRQAIASEIGSERFEQIAGTIALVDSLAATDVERMLKSGAASV